MRPSHRAALAFFRAHALAPLAGLLVLHATALALFLGSGRFPSRPSFDVLSRAWSGGPSVPEPLQLVVFSAAIGWWFTLPIAVGVAVFALGLRFPWTRTVVGLSLLSLVLWRTDPTGLVTWLLD